MTRSGFGLLLGWLTEGVGGEAPGAGEGFGGDRSRRARMAVMHVINAHLQFDCKRSSVLACVTLLTGAWVYSNHRCCDVRLLSYP